MRIKVDPDRCIASGACWSVAPELFRQSEDGVVALIDERPPSELHVKARAAAAACPAAVITIEEDGS
jgi:ferredoxin